jgi:putative DNA-invertase from lambdoid prophage Rac
MTFGRPVVLDAGQRAKVLAQLAEGASVSALARQMATSRQTIMRVRDGAAPARPDGDQMRAEQRNFLDHLNTRT